MCEIGGEFDDVFRYDDIGFKYECEEWYAHGFLCSYDEKRGYAC